MIVIRAYLRALLVMGVALIITAPLMHYEPFTWPQIIFGWMVISLMPACFFLILEIDSPHRR